ncbi:helix-turn-helix domain-containing protein [Streptomyces sp. NPDC021020]|uniref:helix-turn-helix domain-containing protein n=1 Tax=Streptomyces sp. NPDC021020 TaxID=3365109 RepID=UPI0037A935CC
MATVRRWTGREAGLLRQALRMSVRVYAAHLGVGVRTVSKWEQFGASTCPWPDTQAILDEALARSDATAQARFEELLTEGSPRRRPTGTPSLAIADHETWTEDLERIAICLDRQDFAFAATLLKRWLSHAEPHALDDRGLYLYGRSLVLSGDLRRLQGTFQDLLTAKRLYSQAHDVFTELGIPRRAAQVELSLTVVAEMAGRLNLAATRYQQLTADERLGPADRARALLWIGTALAKDGRNEFALHVMGQAARRFEELGEPEDWATAQQKLALAHRGIGDLTRALACIDTARRNGRFETPLQRVQIETAHGHILLTDPDTRSAGQVVLDRASGTAIRYGLKHQLRSIEKFRNDLEYT